MNYVRRDPRPIITSLFTPHLATTATAPWLLIKIPRSEWIVPQSNIPANTFRLYSFTKLYLSVQGLEATHKNF